MKTYLLTGANLIAMLLINQYFIQDWLLNCILIGGFLIVVLGHEMGHMIAFRYYRVRSKLVLIPFKAGIGAEVQATSSTDCLTHFQIAVITLAGLVVNSLLIIPVFVLFLTNFQVYAGAFIIGNSTYVVFNYLPLFQMDGKQFRGTLREGLNLSQWTWGITHRQAAWLRALYWGILLYNIALPVIVVVWAYTR